MCVSIWGLIQSQLKSIEFFQSISAALDQVSDTGVSCYFADITCAGGRWRGGALWNKLHCPQVVG